MEGIQARIKAQCRAKRGLSLRQRRQGKVLQNNKDDSVIGVKTVLDVLTKSQGQSVVGNLKMKEIPFKHFTRNGVSYYIVDGVEYGPTSDNPSSMYSKYSQTYVESELNKTTSTHQQLNLSTCEEEESSLFVQIISDHSYSINVSPHLLDKHQLEGATSTAEIYRQFLTTKPSIYFQQLNLLGNTILHRVTGRKQKSKIWRILQSMRKSLWSMMGKGKL